MIQPILEPQKPAKQRKVYSVIELALTIRRQLESEIGQIWISGEISNFMQPASGHWYFTLKDNKAQLKCAIFKNRNRNVRFTPEDGQQVLIRAKLSLYEPRGDLQLIGEYIEPAGEGALQIAFNRLKEKLNNKGLFAQQHKQSIPSMPKSIAVITSATGAAIKDVLSVLARRMPQIPVIIYPSQVQGDKAAASIIQQIALANQQQKADVILLTRGGGSLEDMWCFNDEQLAEAIFASQIPVVSAVGHEIDISISDLVADLRAPTPSVAAELLVPDQRDLQHKLAQLSRRLDNELQHLLQVSQARLDRLTAKLVHPKQQLAESSAQLRELQQRLFIAQRESFSYKQDQLKEQLYRFASINPQEQINDLQAELKLTEQSLFQALQQLLTEKQQQVSLKAQQLNDFSPLATLARGYTITEDEKGQLLTSAKEATKAKLLTTRFADGDIKSQVQ